jgi:hypothetical protein
MKNNKSFLTFEDNYEVSLLKVLSFVFLIIFTLFGIFPWAEIGTFFSQVTWPFYLVIILYFNSIEINIVPAKFLTFFKKKDN